MGRGCLPPLSRDAVLIHAGAPADAGARSIQPYRSQLWVGTLPLRGFARRSAARPGSDPGEQARHRAVAFHPFPISDVIGIGLEVLFLGFGAPVIDPRSEEHTSELHSLMRRSYAVFCLK